MSRPQRCYTTASDTRMDCDAIDAISRNLSVVIAELGHTQAELGEILRSRAFQILSCRRTLTIEMSHKISEALENSG